MESFPEYARSLATAYADRVAIVERTAYRRFAITYKELYDYSLRLVTLLQKNGVRKGSRIVIFAPNSMTYSGLLLACGLSGIIAVPADINGSPAFAEAIAKKTSASLIVCSRFKQIKVRSRIFIEDMELLASSLKPAKPVTVSPETLFEIVYTSGTTSEPKGVMITHRNIIANIKGVCEAMQLTEEERFLSFLPLSHLFEQSIGLFTAFRFGATVIYTYSRSPRAIGEALREEKITAVVAVPMVLETLKERIERQASVPDSGLMRKAILTKAHSELGNSLKFFVVGGAALDITVERFWNDAGILVLQGYGLTEASPIVTCNTSTNHKPGTVGKRLPNVEVKISKEGEVLVKGNNVTSGYYKDKMETRKLFTKGWMLTGDIGVIDRQGFLTITGRKKTMITSSSGMKVYPEDIERTLKDLPGVHDACAVGITESNRTSIIAAVLPKKGADLDAEIIRGKANQQLAEHQRIQRAVIWPEEDLPRTPTMKIRRNEVAKMLQDHTLENRQRITDQLESLLRAFTAQGIAEDKALADMGVDSLRRLELIARIEDEFGVSIAEQEITERTTLRDIRRIIAAAKKRKLRMTKQGVSKHILAKPLRKMTLKLFRAFCDLQVQGGEKIEEPCVFAANHTSHLDTPAILAAIAGKADHTAVAAAADYFYRGSKIKGWFASTAFNAFPFSRHDDIRESFHRAGSLLDKGWNIIVFPEGGRSTTGSMQSFKTGIAVIAQELRVAVVPVHISGLYAVLPKGRLWPKRGIAKVKFGSALHIRPGESYLSFTKRVEAEVLALKP